MRRLRGSARLALALALVSIGCWPEIASADPPHPGSEVIDPWAPTHAVPTRAFPTLPRATVWRGPNGSEVINPWRHSRAAPRKSKEPFILNPWHGAQAHKVPTAAFPPLDVVDPWRH